MAVLTEKMAEMQRTVKDMQKADEEKRAENERQLSVLRADLRKTAPKVHHTTPMFFLGVDQIYNSIIRPEFQAHRRVGEYYKERPDFTWTVSDFKRLTSGGNHTLLSEVFPLTSGHPFGAQAKLTIDAKSVRFHLSFKETDKDATKGRTVPNVFCTIKDRSKVIIDGHSRDLVISGHYAYFPSKITYDNFSRISFHKVDTALLLAPPYNVDDTLTLDIHVEAPEVVRLVYSLDGSLTWAIDDFRRKQRMEAEGLIDYYYSPHFYVGALRARVRLWLNGRKKFRGRGLSVGVSFLNERKFRLIDAFVDFKHRTRLTLFNPTESYGSISKSGRHDYEFTDAIDVGGAEEIERMLWNDTLYYKINIRIL